jgi:hypothetical protein
MNNKERRIHWVSQSSDKKIGKVLASYSPKTTCPDSCSLKEGGCYAWGLFYLRLLGNKIDSGVLNKTLETALKGASKTAKIARHRVAGDIVGDQLDTLNECKTLENLGYTNIGYTHDWRSEETQVLKTYFRASCQNEDEVIEARNNGWATTIIVDENTPNKIVLSNGERAVMCPVVKKERAINLKADGMSFSNKKERKSWVSEQKKNISIDCNTCTLCKVSDKTEKITVMFEVHGAANTIKSASQKIG